jgi:Domain of unknown function (DUF3854)
VSDYGLHIFPQHAELLKASAIDPEVARERGYVSVDTKKRLETPGFSGRQRNVPGLLIPVHDATGAIALYQYRPDNPRLTDAGKVVKYETPYRSRLVLDVPVRMRERTGDPKYDLWITEGSRKVDAAVSAGLCCIGLLGVTGWRGTNGQGGKTALPDWAHIAINEGRRIYLCFDSDVMTKESVADALAQLGGFVGRRGAAVRYVYLPQDGDDKTGLDDYLAAGGTVDDLITSATPDIRTPRKALHTRTPPPDQPKEVCKPDGVCMHTPLLAHSTDLLAQVIGTVHDLGVTGEARIIRATYLTAVSQVLPEPVSLVVKGTSAGGKSYSTRTTLRLCPAEDFYNVTAGSQRALIYTDEDFEHRTIVMFEATALREIAEVRDGDMTAMLVRTLLSEGQIIYDVAERGDGGRTETRRIIKSGPTNLIVTTTASNLHNENETRLLSLTVDESEEQTRAVLRKIADRRNQLAPAAPPDLEPWHDLFHWLKHHGEHRVYIPYADHLAAAAAASVVRMRRDFGVLLGMIEASAVLHQVNRKRDQHGRIIATPDDYATALDILAEAFAITSGQRVKDSVRRAVTAVGELGGDVTDVTVAQVARYLKRDRTVVTRGLKEAADLGYLTNKETKAGRAARYHTGPDPLPEDRPALPADVPGDACTPPQAAHLLPQVSEGCAGVQPVQGGDGDDCQTCTGCGEPLDSALVKAGFTDHVGTCSVQLGDFAWFGAEAGQ